MRHSPGPAVLVACVLSVLTAGCGGPSSGAPPSGQTAAAAKVNSPKPEDDLASVTLSPEAEKHLAIAVATVKVEPVIQTRTVGGEAVVPPGRSVSVTAPVAGTLSGLAGHVGSVNRGDVLFELLPLQPSERDAHALADQEARAAEASLTETTQRLQRLETLLKEGSASVRAVEEARSAHTIAVATADAARRRLESTARVPVGPRGELRLTAPIAGTIVSVHAANGQAVAAGTVVVELAQTSGLWVRVPIYAGDLAAVDSARPAAIASLGQESTGPWREGRRVAGPPAADARAASVDLFFELPGSGALVRPGERLAVRLALKSAGAERAIVVPRGAIVYDVNGGTWVYEQRAAHVFARRRVELSGPAGDGVVVRRGLAEGMTIVTVGAAELYGTEFFVSK